MSFIQQFAIALFIVSLLGVFRTQGKQKAIASGLLALSLALGFQYGGLNSASYEAIDPIVIDHDGVYDLPARPLKLCITQTGDPKKNEYISQQIKIDTWTHPPQIPTGCVNVPDQYKNKKTTISLGAYGRQYTPEIKKKWGFGSEINNDYDFYIKKVGLGAYPTLHNR